MSETQTKLPDTIRIGFIDYAVTPKDSYETLTSGHCGHIDYIKRLIKAENSDRPPSSVLAILIHEIIHGIMNAYDIRPDDDEERMVLKFEAGWMQVFRDNPAIIEMIQTIFHKKDAL